MWLNGRYTKKGVSLAALVAMNLVLIAAYFSAIVKRSVGCSTTVVLCSSGRGETK
jgi:hypothetical protein